MWVIALPLCALLLSAPALAAGDRGEPVGPEDRAAAERFLREARFEELRSLPIGVTRSRKALLAEGEHRASAIWKTINEYRSMRRFDDRGLPTIGFRDTYKSEIAAYELDKILGLGFVPPTVERRWRGERGSLQLWIEEAMTEADRIDRGIPAPDVRTWNEQMHRVRLWQQLIDNSDYNNINNLLIDPHFRLHVIDHSRAFCLGHDLRSAESLMRFSRSLLARLRELAADELQRQLGRWLTKPQIEALLARRDAILARAEEVVRERGDAALYP